MLEEDDGAARNDLRVDRGVADDPASVEDASADDARVDPSVDRIRPLRNGLIPAKLAVVLTAKLDMLLNALDGVGKDANVPEMAPTVRTALLMVE